MSTQSLPLPSISSNLSYSDKISLLTPWLLSTTNKQEYITSLSTYTSDQLDQLLIIMNNNIKADEEVNILIDHNNILSESYILDTKRYDYINNSCGCNNNLSKSGNTSLNILVNIANNLKLNNIKSENYVLALSNLCNEYDKIIIDNMNIDNNLYEYKNELKFYTESYNNIKLELENLNKSLIDDKTKSDSKNNEINSLRAIEISESEISENFKNLELNLRNITHSDLALQAKKLELKEKELAKLQASVDSYKGLPPDVTLSKKEIKMKQKELEILQSEMNTNISRVRDEII